MPAKSNKQIPSELDWEVWRLTFLEGMDRKQIAQTVGRKIDAVDYHIAEGKRLIAQNVAQCQDVMRHLALPVSFNGLRLIDKAFRTQDPKYLDGAIRFLRNAGVTIEQSEVTHTLKDSRSADQDFDDLMKKMKERAVDATIVESLEPRTATNADPGDIVHGSNKRGIENVGSTSPVSVNPDSDPKSDELNIASQEIVHQKSEILDSPIDVTVDATIRTGDDTTVNYVHVNGVDMSADEIRLAVLCRAQQIVSEKSKSIETSTSLVESDDSILPLDKSHVKNPKSGVE